MRQVVYGQRDLQERFGARCREFWTPDTFGYNGQVPQILRGAGIDRFLTQKLSWNQFTEPPHHSFAVGGDRRLGGARAHAAGRHLQRESSRSPSCARAPPASRTTTARRRACSCSATATAAAGRPRRCSRWRAAPATCRASRACSSRRRREFFDRLEEDLGAPRADRGRAVLRVPPRHLHEPGAHQARQPRRRAAAGRGGGRGGARAPARPRGVPGGGAARALADAAAEPVPRHPPGQLDPRGLRGRRARPRARRRRARPSCATPRSPRSATATPRR